MFQTKFTDTFSIKYPIVQGPMNYVSKAELVAAVSNAGGLGTLTVAGFSSVNELREEIRRTRSLTDKPFSVNLPFTPGRLGITTEQIAEAVIEEKVHSVHSIATGNLPKDILQSLKENGVKVLHKCSKVKHALAAEVEGVDAVALLGFGADGHPGMEEISHLVLIPKAAEKLKIPFVMAGSVADARGFVAALALGADGVLMGTRFLTAKECSVHPKIWERLLQTDETDTVLIGEAHNFPGRRLKNKAALAALELQNKGAPLEEIIQAQSGAKAWEALTKGDPDGGVFGCGQVIGLINEVLTAKEIIEGIISEATNIVSRLGVLSTKP